MPLKTLIAFAIAFTTTACVAEQPDELDVSSEESALHESGVELLHVCECTAVYKQCGSGDNTWLARGQTCRWSDSGDSCPGGYAPVCGKSVPW